VLAVYQRLPEVLGSTATQSYGRLIHAVTPAGARGQPGPVDPRCDSGRGKGAAGVGGGGRAVSH
jgi:hypothetical protein